MKREINSLPFMSKVFMSTSDRLNCLQGTVSIVSATSKNFEGNCQNRCCSREADNCRTRQNVCLHCKKRLAIFPSSAGMSLSKLSLAGNNLIIPVQRKFGYSDMPAGDGKITNPFYSVSGYLISWTWVRLATGSWSWPSTHSSSSCSPSPSCFTSSHRHCKSACRCQ